MSCSLHDAMRLELSGVPVVMLVTDAFTRSVAEQLEAISFTPFEPVYLPHPIAGLPVEQVHAKADQALAQIAARLTGETRSFTPSTASSSCELASDDGPDCEACAVEASNDGTRGSMRV